MFCISPGKGGTLEPGSAPRNRCSSSCPALAPSATLRRDHRPVHVLVRLPGQAHYTASGCRTALQSRSCALSLPGARRPWAPWAHPSGPWKRWRRYRSCPKRRAIGLWSGLRGPLSDMRMQVGWTARPEKVPPRRQSGRVHHWPTGSEPKGHRRKGNTQQRQPLHPPVPDSMASQQEADIELEVESRGGPTYHLRPARSTVEIREHGQETELPLLSLNIPWISPYESLDGS